jgi:regulator of RNase E activity RraA
MTGYTRFAELGAATVSDALDRLGLPGSAHGIAPITDGLRMAGPAYTVRYVPAGDPKGTVGDYIDNIPSGGVAVLDNQTSRSTPATG